MAESCENHGGGPKLRLVGQPTSALQKLPFSRPSCLSRAGVGRQRDRDLDSRGGVVVALINRVPSISTRAMRHVVAHVLPYGTTQTISPKHVLNCRKHPRDPRLPSSMLYTPWASLRASEFRPEHSLAGLGPLGPVARPVYFLGDTTSGNRRSPGPMGLR